MRQNSVEEPVKVSVRDVLFILFYKSRVLIATFLIIVLGTFGYSQLAVPIYEVSGTILLKPLHDSRKQLHIRDRLEVVPVSQQDINSEIRIMTSDTLLRQIVKELHLDQDMESSAVESFLRKINFLQEAEPVEEAVRRLRRNMEVSPITMSNMIGVTLKGRDPDKIAKILDTFFARYIDRHIEVYRSSGELGFYVAQTMQALEKLTEAENNLQDFQIKWSIIKIESQRAENVTLMRLLRENLSLAKSRLAASKTKMEHMRNSFEKGESMPMTEEFRTHEVIVDLLKDLTPLLVEKERISLLYPESSAEYEDAVSQVEGIRKLLADEQNKLMVGLEVDHEALIQYKDNLENEISHIVEASEQLTQKEVNLTRLRREVAQAKKNYELYLDKREEERIGTQRDRSRVANVTVTNWAVVPTAPVYPRKVLLLAVSILAGLFVGTGCTFFAFYLDHTVKRPEDIVRWFGIPVFSTIGTIKGTGKRGRQ